MKKLSSTRRRQLLATAGTAMAATMLVSGAQAAQTVVGPIAPDGTTTISVNGVNIPTQSSTQDAIGAVQLNTGTIVAEVLSTVNGIGQEDSETTQSTIVVEENEVRGSATGNNFAHTIDIGVTENDEDGDGVASLGVSVNAGTVTSAIEGNQIQIDLEDYESGTLSASDNSITGDATGNRGSTTLVGQVPNTYSSGLSGSSSLDSAGSPTNALVAEGSLLASTVQVNAAAVQTNVVEFDGDDNNQVSLDLISNNTNTVFSAPAVDNNVIGATAKGNSSNSTISVQAGGAPTLAGSAVISNGQINTASVGAQNDDSEIEASIYADDGINTLAGSLSVDGNTISASASGNEALGTTTGQAGNRIVLANGVSFAGPGDSASVSTGYTSGTAESDVGADLIINNSQGNAGVANDARLTVTAQVEDSNIDGYVQALEEGSVSVSDNRSTATARGNAASSAFASGENAASFSGSVALANQQTNYYTDVLASNVDGEIDASVDNDINDELADGSVNVDRNTQSATAYGNQVTQDASVAAAIVDLPSDGVFLTGGTGPDGNISVGGGAVVSNLQSLYSSNVTASLSQAWIGVEVDADELEDSSVSVNANRQEAVAVGSSAANGLSVAATNLDGGAGVASVQIATDATTISAEAVGEVSAYAGDVDGSSISVSGNLTRAIAYGGSAANTLNVKAETIEVDEDVDNTASVVTATAGNTFVLDDDNAPQVDAAYGLLNVQSTSANVNASLFGYSVDIDERNPNFLIDVAESVDNGSSLKNESNSAVSAAYGNETTNKALLDVGNLTSDGEFASVLNLTNAQTLTEGSTVSAQMSGPIVATFVGEDVIESSVSTSNNLVQGLVYGNLADNDVVVTSTNIDNSDDSDGFSSVTTDIGAIVSSTDASFTLNNVQSAEGEVYATLVSEGNASAIMTVVGLGAGGLQGDVNGSSVVSNGNTLSAGATANRADNLLDLSGNGFTTTSALVNFQISDASLNANIGIAGVEATPPTDPAPFDYERTLMLSGNWDPDSGMYINAYGTYLIEADTLTQEQIDYLVTQGWSGPAGGYLSQNLPFVNNQIDLAGWNALNNTTTDQIGEVPGAPGTPAVPSQGGVGIAVLDDVVNSTLAVNGNTIAGSVTANSASNTVLVDGTTVAHASDAGSTLVELRDGFGNDVGADSGEFSEVTADHSLSNVQIAGEATLDSAVFNSLGIDLNFGEFTTLSGSSLSVDDNNQSSRSVANTAVNTLEFTATNTDAGTALASNQISTADVGAVSELDMFVPVAGLNTTVSVSDNTNLALAVSNNVTNQLTVEATNSAPIGTARDVRLLSDENVRAGGEHILANQQVAINDVDANATTRIINDDAVDDANLLLNTDGIRTGSVAFTGNTTLAEAAANRAINVADVSASASLGASAGVANYQASTADVSSNATTSAGVGLASDLTVVNNSSITLGQNTTSSLARGNSATNTLNYSAGSNYGGTTIGSDPYVTLTPGGENTVRARAGVLNAQDNTGAVTAQSFQASYVVALNGDTSTATNATIGVIGNAVSAAAYGNTANNSITVAALNSNAASAAIGNVQRNSGPVSASVTTVTYGITSGLGAMSGSSLGVTGNAITATAVGNNSVSSIIGK